MSRGKCPTPTLETLHNHHFNCCVKTMQIIRSEFHQVCAVEAQTCLTIKRLNIVTTAMYTFNSNFCVRVLV